MNTPIPGATASAKGIQNLHKDLSNIPLAKTQNKRKMKEKKFCGSGNSSWEPQMLVETRSGLHNGRSFILLVCMGGSKLGSLLCSFGLCAIWIVLMSGELHWITCLRLPFQCSPISSSLLSGHMKDYPSQTSTVTQGRMKTSSQ